MPIDDTPESSIENTQCLCRQQYGRAPERHRLRYSRRRNEYLIFCPSCGFRTHFDWNLQSVKTDWIRSNRPRDAQVAELWEARLERIKMEYGPAGPLEVEE